MSMVKESDPSLGNHFWLPYTQPDQTDMMYWIHSETGQSGNLTWRRGQVSKSPLIIIKKQLKNK